MEVEARILVSGVVQGVGYRMFVQRLARHLKLRGWVKNLPTGQVEILAEGERGLLDTLVKTLPTGNPYASVSRINTSWHPYRGRFTGFDITF